MQAGGMLPRSRLPHAEVAWKEWGSVTTVTKKMVLSAPYNLRVLGTIGFQGRVASVYRHRVWQTAMLHQRRAKLRAHCGTEVAPVCVDLDSRIEADGVPTAQSRSVETKRCGGENKCARVCK